VNTLGKLILSLLISALTASAQYYDTNILSLYAKILPRIVLYSSLKPGVNSSLSLCIVHSPLDYQSAKFLKKETLEKNSAFKPVITLTPFSALSRCNNAQLIFFLDNDENTLSHSILQAQKQQAIIATYSSAYLSLGAEFSLYIGRNVKPFINLEQSTLRQITFNPVLVRSAKIFKKSHE